MNQELIVRDYDTLFSNRAFELDWSGLLRSLAVQSFLDRKYSQLPFILISFAFNLPVLIPR